VIRTAAVPAILALLHFHLHVHRDFHGPPFDYVGLALAAAASWIGVPGPGEPVLIYAGVLAARHQLDIVGVVLVAWAAATAGGVIGWLIGLKAGRAVLIAPGPFQSLRLGAVRRGENIFDRYAVIAVLVTPSWVAGINKVRGSVYQPTNALSALAWAAGLGFGAYLIGPAVLDFFEDLGLATGIITVVVIIVLVAMEVFWHRRRATRRDQRAGES
jgi:membrane protein DedA with SNARE-associated domain